jgi:hypothetical protein
MCACSDEALLLGELHCPGKSCDAGAPTLGLPLDEQLQFLTYDVTPRTVEPTWVYELPESATCVIQPAPQAGVWVMVYSTSVELVRLDARGQRELSYKLQGADLFVDDALNPELLSYDGLGVTSSSVDARGETASNSIRVSERRQTGMGFVVPGPGGGVRIANFAKAGSSVSAYSASGQMLWRQTGLRDARDFPFEDLGAGHVPAASYGVAPLSDGALALGVPKYVDQISGLQVGRTQGITVLEPDGSVRWDRWFGGPPAFGVLVHAGLDGGVLVANATLLSSTTLLIDRDGAIVSSWTAQRVGYYDVSAHAIAQDAEGDVYVATLSGERDMPMPTVCRLRRDDAVCLALEGVPISSVGPRASVTLQIRDLVAPEPGAVVFSIQEPGLSRPVRIVRVDF